MSDDVRALTHSLGQLLLIQSQQLQATQLVLDSLIGTVCKALPPLTDNLLEHIELVVKLAPPDEPDSHEDATAVRAFHHTIQHYTDLITAIKVHQPQ